MALDLDQAGDRIEAATLGLSHSRLLEAAQQVRNKEINVFMMVDLHREVERLLEAFRVIDRHIKESGY